MDETYDFITGLRAIRDYRDEPLSEEHLDAILEVARWTGSSKNRQDWSFVVITDPERLSELAKAGGFTQPLRDSAATIVIVQEPGGYEFDSGRVAQNMMLAAGALGVASCPITLHHEDVAGSVLGLPDDRTARYAVALGYPGETAKPARFGGRKPLDNLVRRDRY